MLKHSVTTPVLKRHNFQEQRNLGQDNVSLSSSSSSDSSLVGPDPGFDHDHVARHVWDRYTSSSSLAAGNRNNPRTLSGDRSFMDKDTAANNRSSTRVEPGVRSATGLEAGNRKATCLESSAKPRSVPTDTNLNISTVTHLDPKDPPSVLDLSHGDSMEVTNVIKDKDISKEKDTTRSKVVIQDKKNDAKDSKKRRKKLFGLTKSQLKMVGMVAFICLILYIVLLILTEKAASCSGTIQQYLRERQKFLDQISN